MQRFFGKLRRKATKVLSKSMSTYSAEPEGDDEEDSLEILVERVSEAGYSLVFFLDEFDSITQNRYFDEQFFGRLRHIANMYNAAFVTSSQEPLSKLCHAETIAQSPFFNIFTKVVLQLLEEDEAVALINIPAAAQGIHFTDKEIAFVLNLAGCHPFYIQMACSHLFELKRVKGQCVLSDTDFDCIHARFLAEAVDHFDYCLKHLDDKQERAILCAIAASPEDDMVAGAMVPEVEALKRRGLVVQQSGHLRPFSFAFGEFLQEISATPFVDTKPTVGESVEAEHPVNNLDEGNYDSKVWHTVISLERRIRFLLRQRMENRWGENWEQQLGKHCPDMYQEWLEKQQKDRQAFQLYERADMILDYAYMDELEQLIEYDWDFFRTVFEFQPGQGKANKRSLNQKIEDIVRVRNPLAHGRLVPETELRRAHVSCDDLNNQINKSRIETTLKDS